MANTTTCSKALLKLLVYTNKLPQIWFHVWVICQCHQQSFQVACFFFSLALRAPWIAIQQLNPVIVRTDACSWILQKQHLSFPSSPCLTPKLTVSHKASSETLHTWFSAFFVWFPAYCDHLIGPANKSRPLMLYLASLPDEYKTPIAVLFKHLAECPIRCMQDTVPTSLRWPVWNEVPCPIHTIPGALPSSLHPDKILSHFRRIVSKLSRPCED